MVWCVTSRTHTGRHSPSSASLSSTMRKFIYFKKEGEEKRLHLKNKRGGGVLYVQPILETIEQTERLSVFSLKHKSTHSESYHDLTFY